MAIEAVEITAGSGTKIAVDVVDTDKQAQYVKLMDGTDGSATVVAAGGGVEAAAIRVTIASDSTGVVSIDDNGGTVTVDGSVAISSGTVTTVSTVTSVTAVAGMPTGASATAVQGTVAHDSAAAQNPVQVGGMAVSALPAAVANADMAHLITDLLGRLITLPYAPAADTISGCSVALTDTTATNVVATDSGAGLKWYVTDILVTNSHATVGTLVTIQDDEGTPTVLWQGFAAALGGGFSCHFVTPIPTAANAHIHAVNGTTGSSTYICVSAFKAV